MADNHRKAGRKPKIDTTVFRCSVNFTATEKATLLTMYDKVQVESMSAFIKMILFSKPFKVFYMDENTREFIDKLSSLNSLYRTVGVEYGLLVKTLRENFTEAKAMKALYELERKTIELVRISLEIVELARQFDESWSQKISLGNSLYGALVYNGEKVNKEKGRLLDTNKIYNDGSGTINIHRAYEDFLHWMPAHTKTERPMMHISLNPHPDDRLSDTDYTSLAHEYMQKMGLGEMPYLVFKHEDIDRHHIHIVALRVGTDGKAVSDKNNFYRSKDICRELEKKYNLHPAERQRVSPDTPISRLDPSGDLKRQVANIVKLVGMRYRFQTMGEFNAILSLYNVKAEQTNGRVNGRVYHGLVYFATDGDGNVIANPFKASRIGKFASRAAIDGRFERAKKEIDDKGLAQRTRRVVASVLAQSSGKDDFISRLKAEHIDVLFRYTDEGRIYGVTFIDHNTMCVLNGSRLGKEFSANAFEQRFNSVPSETLPDAVPEIENPVGHSDPQDNGENGFSYDDSTADNSRQTNRQTDTKNESRGRDYDDFLPSIPGLDLFHTGPGFDPEEEAFYRAMQRKKKKGRRPKF